MLTNRKLLTFAVALATLSASLQLTRAEFDEQLHHHHHHRLIRRAAVASASASSSSESPNARLQAPAAIGRSLATGPRSADSARPSSLESTTSADDQDSNIQASTQRSVKPSPPSASHTISTQAPPMSPGEEPAGEPLVSGSNSARHRTPNRANHSKPPIRHRHRNYNNDDDGQDDDDDQTARAKFLEDDGEYYPYERNFGYDMVAGPMSTFKSMFDGVMGRFGNPSAGGRNFFDSGRGGGVSSFATSFGGDSSGDDYSEGVSLVSRNGRLSGIRSTTRNGRTRTTLIGNEDDDVNDYQD